MKSVLYNDVSNDWCILKMKEKTMSNRVTNTHRIESSQTRSALTLLKYMEGRDEG